MEEAFAEWWLGVARQIERIDEAERATAPRFNVFRVLRLESYEVRTHSRFLAELLNPRGTHGQGTRFLRSFLQHAGLTKAAAAAEKGSWTVAVEEHHPRYGRFDIVLRCSAPKIVVLIENKVYAAEGSEQCSRYADWLGQAKGWTGFLVYLTPDGHAADSLAGRDGEYVRISYEQLANSLREVDQAELPTAVSGAVVQYARLASELNTNETGATTMSTSNALGKFLGRPENIDISFKVAEALDSMRDGLVRDFFGAIEAATEVQQPRILERWKDKSTPSLQETWFIVYPNKGDELGVSAQIYKDELFYGVCWRNPRRVISDRKPPAAVAVHEAAASFFREEGLDPKDLAADWLVWVTKRMPVEDACRSAATKDGQAAEIGAFLGRLIKRIEAPLRKANEELRGS